MQHYRRTTHSIYDCTYHIVWRTKYRYKVLVGDIGVRARRSAEIMGLRLLEERLFQITYMSMYQFLRIKALANWFNILKGKLLEKYSRSFLNWENVIGENTCGVLDILSVQQEMLRMRWLNLTLKKKNLGENTSATLKLKTRQSCQNHKLWSCSPEWLLRNFCW